MEDMKRNYYYSGDNIIVGVDHGYGNVKTANKIMPTGIKEYDSKPLFSGRVLEFKGKYYSIGEVHKEFIPDKIIDNDYFILTLAAIGEKLDEIGLRSANVQIAAGLPLKWVRSQREEFSNYLLKEKEVTFKYKNKHFSVKFSGADIFPQGYSAIVQRIKEFKGINMLADVGNGTMNVMYINDGKPNENKCWTEKFGTQQCILDVKNKVLEQTGYAMDEDLIGNILINGNNGISEDYYAIINNTVKSYVDQIFRKLREHEYNPEIMKLYVVGGGGIMIKNYGDYDENRVIFIDDICATAKGYEFLAEMKYKRDNKL